MSGHRLTRGQRLMGKIGAAAVLATLSGVPQELVHWFAGDHDSSSMALAGKPPKPPPPPPGPPPPPPPTFPQPAPLQADPNVNWFAAWSQNTAATAPADFFATPTNAPPGNPGASIPFMQAQLNQSAIENKPLGIKVETSLSFADGAALFNTKYAPGTGDRAISYVFGDFESGTRAQVQSRVNALVGQVRMSTWSKNAYVGQWDLTPLDPTAEKYGRMPTLPPGGELGSAHRRWGRADYDSMKVNMANTVLYPGAADLRNTSTGDWLNSNIRTGLFIAPIGRMTQVQNILDQSYKGGDPATDVKNHKQIPWISRFNNYGNAALDNSDEPGLQYVFDTSKPLNGLQTSDQLLGRGDTSALARHYRMRGAYAVNLFEPGVIGYTQEQFEQDVRTGWTGDARLNNIMAAADNKYATMTLNPQVDGLVPPNENAERTGTIWSGQYSETVNNPNSKANKGDMVILASNLDSVNHLIKFGSGDTGTDIYLMKNADGYTWEDNSPNASSRNALIEAGMHKMLQFDLVETRVYNSLADVGSNKKNTYNNRTIWLLNNSYNVFDGDNDRNGRGIPEPTTFGSLAAAGTIAVVCRRQRRKA